MYKPLTKQKRTEKKTNGRGNAFMHKLQNSSKYYAIISKTTYIKYKWHFGRKLCYVIKSPYEWTSLYISRVLHFYLLAIFKGLNAMLSLAHLCINLSSAHFKVDSLCESYNIQKLDWVPVNGNYLYVNYVCMYILRNKLIDWITQLSAFRYKWVNTILCRRRIAINVWQKASAAA